MSKYSSSNLHFYTSRPVYYNSRVCLLHIESLSTMFFVNHFSVSKSFATVNHFGEVSFSWWNFFRAKTGPRIILVKDHFSVEKLYFSQSPESAGQTNADADNLRFHIPRPLIVSAPSARKT